jgi:salicylate hydroxylase
MLQYLAAGAGMAIEDAWVLARSLVQMPDNPAQALLDYQNQRYMRTGRVQYTARFFGELYHASGVARELRKQLLGAPRAAGADNPMAWLYDGIE